MAILFSRVCGVSVPGPQRSGRRVLGKGLGKGYTVRKDWNWLVRRACLAQVQSPRFSRTVRFILGSQDMESRRKRVGVVSHGYNQVKRQGLASHEVEGSYPPGSGIESRALQ